MEAPRRIFLIAFVAASLTIVGANAAAKGKKRGPRKARTWTPMVRILGPTIVAFMPRYLAEASDADEGAGEAKWHFNKAISDARECLEDAGKHVDVEVVVGSEMIIDDGSKVANVRFPRTWPHSMGAYLVDINRPPCLVHTGVGPSLLIPILPQAAGQYFGVSSCIDEDVGIGDYGCGGAG